MKLNTETVKEVINYIDKWFVDNETNKEHYDVYRWWNNFMKNQIEFKFGISEPPSKPLLCDECIIASVCVNKKSGSECSYK